MQEEINLLTQSNYNKYGYTYCNSTGNDDVIRYELILRGSQMLLHANDEIREIYGACFTAKEIAQQPDLWEQVYLNFQSKHHEIIGFFSSISRKHERVRVIFTGAGTSAFVGDTIVPYIKE